MWNTKITSLIDKNETKTKTFCLWMSNSKKSTWKNHNRSSWILELDTASCKVIQPGGDWNIYYHKQDLTIQKQGWHYLLQTLRTSGYIRQCLFEPKSAYLVQSPRQAHLFHNIYGVWLRHYPHSKHASSQKHNGPQFPDALFKYT